MRGSQAHRGVQSDEPRPFMNRFGTSMLTCWRRRARQRRRNSYGVTLFDTPPTRSSTTQ
jgi:hypothetical protein